MTYSTDIPCRNCGRLWEEHIRKEILSTSTYKGADGGRRVEEDFLIMYTFCEISEDGKSADLERTFRP